MRKSDGRRETLRDSGGYRRRGRRRHRPRRRRRRLCRRENNECMRGARGEMGLVVPRERQRVSRTRVRSPPLAERLSTYHTYTTGAFRNPRALPVFSIPWERSLSPPRRSPLPLRSLLRPASPFFLPLFFSFFFTLPRHHPRGKTPLNIYATAHALRMLYFSSHSV